MLKSDAIELFGSKNATAKALGLTYQAVIMWPDVLTDPIIFRIVFHLIRLNRSKEARAIVKRFADPCIE